MNIKKLFELLKNAETVLAFVVTAATLIGVFTAPHLKKYILAIALWFVLSSLLLGYFRSYKHAKNKKTQIKISKNNKIFIHPIHFTIFGFIVITAGMIWIIGDLLPRKYALSSFPKDEFGIVLAEFTYGDSNLSYPEGRNRRDLLYEDMNRMLQRPDLNLSENVLIQKYPSIHSEKEAIKIAEKLNADIIVWGSISSTETSELRPNFTILLDVYGELPNPNLFNIQINGENTASMLTNRTRAITNYVLSLYYLNNPDRAEYYTAIRLLDAGIKEAEEELSTNTSGKLDLSYNLALFHTTRGRAFAAVGNSELALNDYKRALDYSANFIGALIGIGNIYYNNYYVTNDLENLDSAYTYYEKALPSWGAYYGLGLVSHSQEIYQTAVVYFQNALSNALKNYPEDSTPIIKIHFMLGQTYMRQGDFGKSESELILVCESNKISSDLKNWACTDLNTLNLHPSPLNVSMPTNSPMLTSIPPTQIPPTQIPPTPCPTNSQTPGKCK